MQSLRESRTSVALSQGSMKVWAAPFAVVTRLRRSARRRVGVREAERVVLHEMNEEFFDSV
jgi:hypothetical protein